MLWAYALLASGALFIAVPVMMEKFSPLFVVIAVMLIGAGLKLLV